MSMMTMWKEEQNIDIKVSHYFPTGRGYAPVRWTYLSQDSLSLGQDEDFHSAKPSSKNATSDSRSNCNNKQSTRTWNIAADTGMCVSVCQHNGFQTLSALKGKNNKLPRSGK